MNNRKKNKRKSKNFTFYLLKVQELLKWYILIHLYWDINGHTLCIFCVRYWCIICGCCFRHLRPTLTTAVRYTPSSAGTMKLTHYSGKILFLPGEESKRERQKYGHEKYENMTTLDGVTCSSVSIRLLYSSLFYFAVNCNAKCALAHGLK